MNPNDLYRGRSPSIPRRVRFFRDGERPPIARRLKFTDSTETIPTKTVSKKEEEEQVSFCKSVIIVAGACVIGIAILKTLGEYFRDRNSSNSL